MKSNEWNVRKVAEFFDTPESQILGIWYTMGCLGIDTKDGDINMNMSSEEANAFRLNK